MKNTFKKETGITLVALVITIIILLILAGITISQLSGSGLFENAKLAKERSIKAEMIESLTLALQELQLEKRGKATIEDITQDWVDSKLKDYKNTVKEDASNNSKIITMEKNNIIAKYTIDGTFGVTQIPVDQENIQFSYEIGERNDNKVNITIKVQDKQNGLAKLEILDTDTIIDFEETKKEKEVNYEVEIGKEYKVKITSTTGETREEKILIEKYYHKVTISLEQGINIDNTATKAEYNKPYKATITVAEGYYFKTLTVTMGGENITVDKTTGIVDIEKVTGDIVITATIKTRLVDYGTSISPLYSTLYQGTTENCKKITKNHSKDVYYSGNFAYPHSISLGDDLKLLNKKGNTSYSSSAAYIYSGTNVYEFDSISETNRWIRVWICGGWYTLSHSFSEFQLGFTDGTYMTLNDAVTNGYIEPLVICSASQTQQSYVHSSMENVLSGGSSGVANYGEGMIFFKVKNVALSSIKMYANKNYDTSYNDGLAVYQAPEDFELSIVEW